MPRGRFASEIIIDENERLVVHWDVDPPWTKPYPMLFYTPNMKDTNVHYHITLTRAQARKLQKWLRDFLDGRNMKLGDLRRWRTLGRKKS